MTTTISPHDTGDIPVGEATRNLAPFVAGLPPALRRPDASGEFPIVEPTAPARLVGAEELARLAAGETLILPDDATLVPLRQAVPTVYQRPAPMWHVGRHRKADPVWAWAAIRIGSFLLVAATATIVAIAVVR